MISLFLQGNEVDQYIVTHLYGEIGKQVDTNNQTLNGSILLADIMSESFMQVMNNRSTLDRSLIVKQRIAKKNTTNIKKMNAFETYIALVKGYCCVVILFIPKAFTNGGWLWGNVCILISAWFTTMCARKLV